MNKIKKFYQNYFIKTHIALFNLTITDKIYKNFNNRFL